MKTSVEKFAISAVHNKAHSQYDMSRLGHNGISENALR